MSTTHREAFCVKKLWFRFRRTRQSNCVFLTTKSNCSIIPLDLVGRNFASNFACTLASCRVQQGAPRAAAPQVWRRQRIKGLHQWLRMMDEKVRSARTLMGTMKADGQKGAINKREGFHQKIVESCRQACIITCM
ncbi:uncharacterized protein LOC143240068 [Tachypleus tridentatus]|uniref:uncharacterized protein LOC143240068 n=1 Tax=Tachypleus tridentatus TaxID=6853 RepID=UPI003FD4483D